MKAWIDPPGTALKEQCPVPLEVPRGPWRFPEVPGGSQRSLEVIRGPRRALRLRITLCFDKHGLKFSKKLHETGLDIIKLDDNLYPRRVRHGELGFHKGVG